MQHSLTAPWPPATASTQDSVKVSLPAVPAIAHKIKESQQARKLNVFFHLYNVQTELFLLIILLFCFHIPNLRTISKL